MDRTPAASLIDDGAWEGLIAMFQSAGPALAAGEKAVAALKTKDFQLCFEQAHEAMKGFEALKEGVKAFTPVKAISTGRPKHGGASPA